MSDVSSETWWLVLVSPSCRYNFWWCGKDSPHPLQVEGRSEAGFLQRLQRLIRDSSEAAGSSCCLPGKPVSFSAPGDLVF